MISKLITLTAKEGKEQELQQAVSAMVEPSRAEQGCIKYDAYFDTAAPAEIYLVEEWENEETLAAHKTTTHFVEFKTVMPELVADKGGIALGQL